MVGERVAEVHQSIEAAKQQPDRDSGAGTRTKARRGAQASQAYFSQRDEELHKFDDLATKRHLKKKIERRNAAILARSTLVADEEEANNSEAVYELSESEPEYDSDGEPVVYIPRRLLPAYREQMKG